MSALTNHYSLLKDINLDLLYQKNSKQGNKKNELVYRAVNNKQKKLNIRNYEKFI
jgi:hypothetical protein